MPQDLCEFRELIYDESSKKLLMREDAGSLSKIGMVAWRVRLIVPEYPEGREVIIIANDISHQIGSFSMREHNLYNAASKLSREEGLPRIYIAANSGARIGLSSDVSLPFVILRSLFYKRYMLTQLSSQPQFSTLHYHFRCPF